MEINDDDLVVGIEDENIYAVQDLRLVTNKNIILRKRSQEEIKDIKEQIKAVENYKPIFKPLFGRKY